MTRAAKAALLVFAPATTQPPPKLQRTLAFVVALRIEFTIIQPAFC
jgi:hypothetical protein